MGYYRKECVRQKASISSACATCRKKMELELYERYSEQMRKKDEQNTELIAEQAYGLILRAAPIAYARVTGLKGEDIYPYMSELVKVVDTIGADSGMLAGELYEETGVMAVTTDEGLIFGTREEYEREGWRWPGDAEQE